MNLQTSTSLSLSANSCGDYLDSSGEAILATRANKLKSPCPVARKAYFSFMHSGMKGV